MKSLRTKVVLLVASGLALAGLGSCAPIQAVTNLFSNLVGTITGA